MKRIRALVLALCFLFALGGCNQASQSEKSYSAASLPPDAPAHTEVGSIADIINNGAVSVEYKLGDEWVSENIDTATAKALIGRLTDAFPEQFGLVASAYMPEDIIIKVNLEESAQHKVNVNSSAADIREITISTIEISHDGVAFLMPQCTPLGKIKDIDTVLSPDASEK